MEVSSISELEKKQKRTINNNKVGIIVVGNEILSGHTLDTNSNWLAKNLCESGYEIKRITIIPDDIYEISMTLKRFIEEFKFDIIFLCGGLGPTPDDKTIEGIANALKLKLCINEEALKFIKKRYREEWVKGRISKPTLTKGRKKMAYLPKGCIVLPNYVGFGPGIVIKHETGTKDVLIFALPGVPEELRHIYTEFIKEKILFSYPSRTYTKEITIKRSESTIYELLTEIEKNYPNISVESHPNLKKMETLLRIKGKNKKEVMQAIQYVEEFVRNKNKKH